MYAIIEAGGAQHKVTEGQVIRVNDTNLPVGEEVPFKVKLYCDETGLLVGRPDLSEVKVTGIVRAEIRGRKVRIHRFRPRKRYQRRVGHRQTYTVVKINKIAKEPSAAPVAPETPPVTATPPTPEMPAVES
jgi:large subunit ribosomal protein L21